MGLLDKIGLGRKKARPVGQSLEKGRDLDPRARQKNIAVKAGIFMVLVLITLAAFPRAELYEYTVQVGDVWRQDTLRAPFAFAIYKHPDTLEIERERVRQRTPPYFREVPNAQERMTTNRDTILRQLHHIFEAYGSYKLNQSRGRLDVAANDSARYVELRRSSRLRTLTPRQWQLLAEDYSKRIPGLTRSTRELPEGPPLYEQLLREAWEFGAQYNNRGVLDVPLDSVYTDQIIVRDERGSTQTMVDKVGLFGINETYGAAQQAFQSIHQDRPELANIASNFFRMIFVPSLQYMRGETMREWQRKQQSISPVEGKVEEGQLLVGEDQIITPEIKRRLTSLERAQAERRGRTIVWRRALGQTLFTLATFAIFFLYRFLVRRNIFDNNRLVLLIAILFAIIIGLFAIAIRVPIVGMLTVPVAVVSVLLTVMFDSRVGLFGTLALSLLGGLLLGYDFEFTFATIFAGTLGVFSVRDIKNRGQFFISSGFVFLGYLVVLGGSLLYVGRSAEVFGLDVLRVAVNSFFLILAYPLLWVFERTFYITTDLTLLELSDTNRPLLKELSLRAPGTFNHSLQVANLAEAAANAIGANALLTRVGALYHDIGKMLKPEYFVENQRPGNNPHDQLKPRMSALIIASHVKEGLEMGRQYNLPQPVLNFIPMHHGTTRIEYFYRKALEARSDAESEVMESEFRYPGPRPTSKETAILMLADSVEAASRSLSEPTHKRLETLIDMIFKARIEDGQLDNTDLTFRDLKEIKETFLTLLLGIYHVRVKYPDQEEQEQEVEETAEATTPDQQQEAKDVASSEEEGASRLSGTVGIPEQSIHAPSGGDGQPLEAGRSDAVGEENGEEAAEPNGQDDVAEQTDSTREPTGDATEETSAPEEDLPDQTRGDAG